jgi:hypothetical protein|tara:strand:- start:2344 stop:3540 length:1197 start_codon:yes stop_codon:yes gene_type:complete
MSLSSKIGQFARFFILISLVSCKNDAEQKSLIKSIAYTVDTVRINLDKNQLYDYPRFSVFKTDSIDYFYGYNQSLHRLDIFSLTEGEFINSIPLNTDGPNAVDSPFDFFIYQPDSIFLYGRNYSLDIINDQGVVVAKELLPLSRNSSGVGKQKVGYLSHSVHFKLYVDSASNSVFFHSYSMESILNKSVYYEVPILAELNLQTGKVKDYPFHFPDSYLLDGEYLGEYMNPNIVLSDSLIIFSFPNSPVVNVYDRKSGKLISRTIESGFSINTVKSLPSETYSEIHLRLNHLIENPYFYHTVFDPYRNLFYRTHRGEHPNPDLSLGNLNFSQTKDYLTVMDHSLNLLQEIELPAHKYDALSFFVTKDGLYFPYTHYLNEDVTEDKLEFHVYKFQIANED